jgi:hypothetical protein
LLLPPEEDQEDDEADDEENGAASLTDEPVVEADSPSPHPSAEDLPCSLQPGDPQNALPALQDEVNQFVWSACLRVANSP